MYNLCWVYVKKMVKLYIFLYSVKQIVEEKKIEFGLIKNISLWIIFFTFCHPITRTPFLKLTFLLLLFSVLFSFLTQKYIKKKPFIFFPPLINTFKYFLHFFFFSNIFLEVELSLFPFPRLCLPSRVLI